jgi:imidazolonepropionase-like amidohydrolase
LWALAGDLLWDGVADAALSGYCVVICGDRIQAVCTVEEAQRSKLPLQQHAGCLMPGLIDAHVHMEFSEKYQLHEQPVLSTKQLLADMADRAHRMVRSGITTARDLGGRNFVALSLRDEIRAGKLLGPQLLCAGQPITTPAGHCHQWGGAAANVFEAKAVVERQVEHGVDLIKIMATGGMRTPGTDVQQAQFSESDLRQIVATASAHGRPVAAHAHGTAGVVAAVAAGCSTIEHCTWIGPGAGAQKYCIT